MNRQKALELLPTLIAFTEGKRIQKQLIVNNEWVDAGDDIHFTCDSDRYRIAPEPGVFVRIQHGKEPRKFWAAGFKPEFNAEEELVRAIAHDPDANYHIVEYIEKVK